ncbi:MAG: S8 family serine peptidase, partial [Promethearchaeota archaeon]
MNSFLNKKANLKKINIRYQYNVIPVLYVKIKSQTLKKIESNDLIHKIDIDYRCYLSDNSTGEPIQNNREISSVFQEKNNKGQGIRIALVDSGIEPNLKKLKKSIVSKVDITTEPWDDLAGHGTLMAGVIADIVPKSEFVDVKISSRSGLVY